MDIIDPPHDVLKPVYVDGRVQLYDIYINGEWIGSRRTWQQCSLSIDYHKRKHK